ncbi:MAG: dTDP-4-dehydrorhamnose reductase [Longimicrobiaceae bacterium]
MRVLITGGGGMLARAVADEYRSRGDDCVARSRGELDVTDRCAVGRAFGVIRPEVVVHCAAFTAVDAAEAAEAEAFRVNADATRNVAAACHASGALLVYPSTDYVFDGRAMNPYPPDYPRAPLNAYGHSKAAGEDAARAAARFLTVRTSWLYGAGGPNFVETMLRFGRGDSAVRVVDDQVGRPTSTALLAGVIQELVAAGAEGVFHVTGGGEPVSWHGFAGEIFRQTALRVELEPVDSAEYPAAAQRPRFSVLDCRATEAAIGRRLPDWNDALSEYLTSRGTISSGDPAPFLPATR